MSSPQWWASVLGAVLVLGCGDDPAATLIVDLKTDLVPVGEFVGVRTEVQRGAFTPGVPSGQREEIVVTASQEFLSGVRIAELEGVPTGALFVRVSALGPGGEVVVDRITTVRVTGTVALTVLLTRDCRGVVCPPDGSSSLTACLGGRCVDPACSPENPAACGDPTCDDARPCPEGVTCVQQACIGGTCLADPDDTRCPPEELCDIDRGCVRRDGTEPDGGLCEMTESLCTGGVDEDCDEQVDCADSDCEGATCGEFGLVCRAGACGCADGMAEGACDDGADGDCDGLVDCADPECDDVACGPDGLVCIAKSCGCPGSAPETECDDGQDDDCDGSSDCDDADCDGRACGGAGQMCVTGACSCPGGTGVETLCANGADDDCDGSPDCDDSDCETQVCGTVVNGPYGACGGFSGMCGETGTQSRMVTTPTCTAGACAPIVTTQMQSCMRDTDGDSCGTRTVGTWGSCGGFTNACDETGTQSRTITDHLCGTGTCRTTTTTERRGCSRTVPDGRSCGGTWMRCCSGTCTDLTSNAHCGACRVNCGAIGTTCATTGTGGYACRGCSTNAECQSELSASATCYNVSAPPAFCQCQCPSTTVCANAGCGANFFCHSCPGHNFCAPFGGTCP